MLTAGFIRPDVNCNILETNLLTREHGGSLCNIFIIIEIFEWTVETLLTETGGEHKVNQKQFNSHVGVNVAADCVSVSA